MLPAQDCVIGVEPPSSPCRPSRRLLPDSPDFGVSGGIQPRAHFHHFHRRTDALMTKLAGSFPLGREGDGGVGSDLYHPGRLKQVSGGESLTRRWLSAGACLAGWRAMRLAGRCRPVEARRTGRLPSTAWRLHRDAVQDQHETSRDQGPAEPTWRADGTSRWRGWD